MSRCKKARYRPLTIGRSYAAIMPSCADLRSSFAGRPDDPLTSVRIVTKEFLEPIAWVMALVIIGHHRL